MARRSSSEAVAWLLFSAGGMAAALLIPVLLVLFGVAFPLGWLTPPEYAHLLSALSNPLIRIALLVLCVLSLAHCAHRLRHTVIDLLRIRRLRPAIGVLCYGGAVAGSLWAVIVLFQ